MTNYIYSNILSWNIIENTSGHVGTRTCVAGVSQQTCYAIDCYALHHHASPNKDASNPELSNTLFFYQ